MKLTNLKIDKSWTLFLDRDGVINMRLIDDYVKNIEEFVFLIGVKEALQIFSQYFGRIVIVTNQQGVGKGLMTERQVEKIHTTMLDEIEDAGGRIDAVYYAPQLHAEKSNMRKPEIGMGLKAQNDFPEIDFSKSIMVGDSPSDIGFGKALNMYTTFIKSKRLNLSVEEPNADFCFDSLYEMANLLT